MNRARHRLALEGKTTKKYYITFVSYVDSRDWKEEYTTDMIVKGVSDNIKSGSIVLFHNAAKNTPKALPLILERLIADGYSFKLISEMIYKDNYEIKHDGTQCKKEN